MIMLKKILEYKYLLKYGALIIALFKYVELFISDVESFEKSNRTIDVEVQPKNTEDEKVS